MIWFLFPFPLWFQVWSGSLPKDFVYPKSPERILFCGWRRDMEDMIMVMLLEISCYGLWLFYLIFYVFKCHCL